MTQPANELTKRTRAVCRRLAKLYPESRCALEHSSPYQLLVATILSAQCTDAMVNRVTPNLFARYPSPASLALAKLSELEGIIQSTGFYRNKAKNLKTCAEQIVERHGGEVPPRMEDLVELAGVARKTANVVLGTAFGIPGFPVDTHVLRLARRMGLVETGDPVKVEREICARLPKKEWTMFSHRLIEHGRKVCNARRPDCDACGVVDLCPRVGVRMES